MSHSDSENAQCASGNKSNVWKNEGFRYKVLPVLVLNVLESHGQLKSPTNIVQF